MIRRATPADAGAIAGIWNPIIHETVATFTTTGKDADALADVIATSPFWVADAAGAVVGFATYAPFRGGPGYAHTKEHSVHLAPEARGKGLGRALMAELEDHARAAGVHSVFAGIAGENVGAIAFHTALGYAQAARLAQVGWKFGRWHDLVLMQKFL